MKKPITKRAELVPLSNALEGFEKLYVNGVSKTEQPDGHAIWAEPQLYLLPFCVPQDKTADRFRSIKITETIKLADKTRTRTFRVNPDPDYGLPGSFDLEVMTGVYRLADEQMSGQGTVPDFIDLGSLKSFVALIGKPYSGKYAAMVKESLKRLMSTICVSEGFFYSKPRDLYIAESFTFISAVEIAGENDFNGGVYEKTRIKLHEFIRENLNASFRTLIDFDSVRLLKTEIAKPLSLHIAYRIFKNKSSEWIVDYEWLADRLAIKKHDVLWRARDQFKLPLKELQETGFIETWEWIGKKLRLVAGTRLALMHQKRVQAKDAWLAHQQEKIRVEQLVISLPPRTKTESERQAAFDPLAAICTEFAVRGWKAIQAKAVARGLTPEILIQESANRGHTIRALD